MMRKAVLVPAARVAAFGSLLALLGAGVQSCTSAVELASTRRDGNITVDGNESEWSSRLSYLKKSSLAVGIQHDDHSMYLCLKTTDPTFVRRIHMQGLIVWIDGSGKSERSFGIRYPLGFSGRGPVPQERTDVPGDDVRGQSRPPEEPMAGIMADVDLLSSTRENDFERVPTMVLTKEFGLRAAIRGDRESLVYELLIPRSIVGRLDLRGSATVGLGIELGEHKQMAQSRRDGRGEGGRRPEIGEDERGGMGPGGGRPGGMPGGPGGQKMTSEKFERWLHVELGASDTNNPGRK